MVMYFAGIQLPKQTQFGNYSENLIGRHILL